MNDSVITELRLRFDSSQQQCVHLVGVCFHIGEKIEKQLERLQHGILAYFEISNDPETVLKAE